MKDDMPEFTPLEAELLERLQEMKASLPNFLASISVCERIAAVSLLSRRYPNISGEIAGALISDPLRVSMVYPGDAEGVSKIDMTAFEADFTSPPCERSAAADSLPVPTPEQMREAREYLDTLDPEDRDARIARVMDLAREAQGLGLTDDEIGRVLGPWGLDWPAGSGDYHGWNDITQGER